MNRKAPTPQIKKESELANYFKSVIPELSETESEHNWSKFTERFNQLAEICLFCHIYDTFLESIKKVRDCLNNSLLTERTTLSLSAMSFVEVLAKTYNTNFSPYLELVMIPLLEITGKTKKVSVNKATATINSIITHTKSPAIVPYLSPNLSSKNRQIRKLACEFLLKCMNTIESKRLNIHISVVINAIKNGVVDADPGVRDASKKVFETFKKLFPDSMPDLIAVLCDTAKKNLRINASSTSSTSSVNRIRPTAIPRSRSSTNPVQSKTSPQSSTTQRPIANPTSRFTRPTIPPHASSSTDPNSRPIRNPISRTNSATSAIHNRTSSSTVSRPLSSSLAKRPSPDRPSTSRESIHLRNNSSHTIPSRTNVSSSAIRSSTATSVKRPLPRDSSSQMPSKLSRSGGSSEGPTKSSASSSVIRSSANTSAKRPLPNDSSSQLPSKLPRSGDSSEDLTKSSASSPAVANILARSRAIIDTFSSSKKPPVYRTVSSTTHATRSTNSANSTTLPFSTKPEPSSSKPSITAELPAKKNYFKYDKALEVLAKSRSGVVEIPKPSSSRSISIPLFNPATSKNKQVGRATESSSRSVTSSSTQSSITLKDSQVGNALESYSNPIVASSDRDLSVYDKATEIMTQSLSGKVTQPSSVNSSSNLPNNQVDLASVAASPTVFINSSKPQAPSDTEFSRPQQVSSNNELSIPQVSLNSLQPNAPEGSMSRSNNVTPRTSYSGIGAIDSPPFHLLGPMSPRLGQRSVPSSPSNSNRHGIDLSVFTVVKSRNRSEATTAHQSETN